MEIIRTITAMRLRLATENHTALVPTMGNLHAGHLELIRVAREKTGAAGCVVVSIFVNRLQFAPHEDFATYPRTLEHDCARAAEAGADIVFAPDEHELYPVAQQFLVEPSPLQHLLDGAVRPGHFRGVATVVLKLFNMVQPQVAVFGKKDYQQGRVLDNMVRQVNLPIEVLLAETVRADDGLALSSRNGYLSVTERAEAPHLNLALREIKAALQQGNRDFAALETNTQHMLVARGWQPDYVTIRRQRDLLAPAKDDHALVVLAAARLGGTRLIDNLEIAV